MDSFYGGLKQRKVFQWVFAYVAGAWVVVQVMDVVAEPWGLTAGLVRGGQALLALGLPLVLVLAWYHGEKGRQRVSGPEFVILASLFILAGGVFWAFDPLEDRAPAAVAREQPGLVLAVLPFDNLSSNAENGYFADGVHEDILTALSKIGDLTVISRTSVMRYRDAPESNLRQIGEELGATAILEGSVRRAGNRILVTTQLIDVATDSHIWAEDYERELNDVFAVQREIAERVAEALQATLTPEEATRIARAPTGNLDAYDFVLRAREASRARTEEGNEEAIRLYNLALELDPEYALAWAGLSARYADRPYRYGGDPAWGDSALVLAERALELDPEASAAHGALAFVYGTKGWRQRATEANLRALELDPNRPSSTNNIAVAHRLAGRWDEAITWYERAISLDPIGMTARSNLANVYLDIGDTARAVSLRRENLALQDPDGVVALGMQAYLAVIEDGDYERALEIREQLIEREPGSSDMRFDAARTAFRAGDYEREVEHMTEGLRLSPNARVGALRHGLALIQTGRQQEGQAALVEVIALRRGQIAGGAEEPAPLQDLVVAYAALGETAEAMDALGRLYETGYMRPVGTDDFSRGLALTSLESEPRFQEVWRQMEEDLAEMRRRIEAR